MTIAPASSDVTAAVVVGSAVREARGNQTGRTREGRRLTERIEVNNECKSREVGICPGG